MGLLDFKALFRSWITPYLTEIKANAGSGGGSSYVPNKTHIQTFNTPVNCNNSGSILIKEYDPITIQAGKSIRVDAEFVTRNDSTSWGGLYLEIHCKINGVQKNLGHPGYHSSVMSDRAKVIPIERRMYTFDFIEELSLNPLLDYTVSFLFYGKSYSGITQINNNSAQNVVAHGQGSTPESYGASQQYSKLIITEISDLVIH
jgi:hypothetical protein